MFFALFVLFQVLACHSETSALNGVLTPRSSRSSETQCSLSLCQDSPLQCSDENIDACPPGLFCMDGQCECGQDYPHRYIRCDNFTHRSEVPRLICINYDEERNVTVVGNCLRLIIQNNTIGVDYAHNVLYHQLPISVYQLNEEMCQNLNRTGVLCGRCKHGFYPLAYSFDWKCIPCPDSGLNWLKYIAAACIPLTTFYFLILFFKINAASSHLFAVIFFCQNMTVPFLARSVLIETESTIPSYLVAIKILFSLYGIVNLDFFRPFYSDLCLGIGVLPTLVLDYLIALYPLLLMILSYTLILMYEKNFRILTFLWSPFRRLFSLFRKNWDIKTSVIDAYATMFFLSNVKLLSVSSDLLTPVPVYHLHPNHYNKTLGLNYAGHIEYFGKTHVPYAILAVVVLFVFIIVPVLVLAFYQFYFFRKFNHLEIFHRFIDSFQRCYKDGSEPGTRDCRWFSSMFLIVRIVQFSLYMVTDKNIFHSFIIITFILHATLVATVQPYKPSCSHFKVINVVLLQCLTMLAIAILAVTFAKYMAFQFITLFYVFGIIFGSIPLLYALFTSFHWIYTHARTSVYILHRVRAWKLKEFWQQDGQQDLDESLPHRLEHSDNYPRENITNFENVFLQKAVSETTTNKTY